MKSQSTKQFDSLIKKARKQGQRAKLKKSDIKAVVREARLAPKRTSAELKGISQTS